MTRTVAMLETYPEDIGALERDALAACIDACNDCAQSCGACADACLSETMIDELRKCIRMNLDCADICSTTARVLTRQTAFDAELMRTIVAACVQACRSCGDECMAHGDMHEHCRVCAEACRACEDACNRLLVAPS